MPTNPPRLYLVDGAALAYRAYFAFVNRPLTNASGMNTSAVFGFVNVLFSLLEKEDPEYFAVVFDSDKPTFRHEKYAAYKATRQKMPQDMAESLPYLERVVKALGIPWVVQPGYEADDLIGTLVKRAEKKGIHSFIVSGDKDFMQLFSPRVHMYHPRRPDDLVLQGEKDVREKFGVPPEKVVDVLALMGDSSDNVPGVPGVGPKTAAELVRKYGSLDAVLRSAEKISKPKLREALLRHRDQALLSRELVTIDCQAPLAQDLEDLKRRAPDVERTRELFRELEFHGLWKRFWERHAGSAAESETTPAEPAFGPDPKEEKETDGAGKKRKGKKKPEASEEAAPLKPLGDYRRLRTLSELEEALEEARQAGAVAVDTETGGLNPRRDPLVGISLSWKEGSAVYIPFNANLPEEDLWKRLKPFLEDASVPKGGQNVKFDWEVLQSRGVPAAPPAFDTLLESYLLDSSLRNHNLDQLALRHLSLQKIPTEALIGKGKKRVSMATVDPDRVAVYACEDADVALRLHRLFEPRLRKRGLEKLYREVELPLALVLAAMERRGVALDVEHLRKLSEEAAREMARLEEAVYREAGETFNVGSTQQLGRILFEKLQVHKIAGLRAKRTKTGWATDVDVLEALKGVPVADLVLEYRQLAKLRNTYLDVLPALVDPEDGRLHTSFNQTVAATGRLSSSDPNLQNIPVRSEFGRKIRRAFRAAEGCVLVSADYSQVELRLLAHLSGDEALIDAFRRGEDVHARTASRVFKVPLEKVDRNMRAQAKTINFGVLYGMGPQRLARENGVTLTEAKAFIEGYFREFPGVRKYLDAQIERARQEKKAVTILGRERPLPEIDSANAGLRVNAEHMAVNTPIQGSAADLIKVAMVRIHAELQERGMESGMVLQVHDELVFEAPKREAEEVKKIAVREMEGAMKLQVPLKVEVGEGPTWLDAH